MLHSQFHHCALDFPNSCAVLSRIQTGEADSQQLREHLKGYPIPLGVGRHTLTEFIFYAN